jgi:lantibiotic modifying enzyme
MTADGRTGLAMTSFKERVMHVAEFAAARIADAVGADAVLNEGYRVAELGPGLLGGGGLALLFEIMRQSGSRARDWQALTKQCLRAGTSGETPAAGLFTGAAGSLFAAKYIARARGGYDGFIAGLETHVTGALYELTQLRDTAHDHEVDLISGLAGIYVALGAPPLSADLEAARRSIARMVENPDGLLRVITANDTLSPPRVNLGVAHGLPGVVAAYLMGAHDPAVVSRAVEYLIAVSVDGAGSRWPYQAGDGGAARSAWCYGAPGVSAVLCDAACALADDDLVATALRSACTAAAHPLAEKGVRDDALCHGKSGIALTLWVVSRLTGDCAASLQAQDLIAEVADDYRTDLAFGYVREAMDRSVAHDATFLTGTAGIAAAMVTMAGKADPSWLSAFGLRDCRAVS